MNLLLARKYPLFSWQLLVIVSYQWIIKSLNKIWQKWCNSFPVLFLIRKHSSEIPLCFSFSNLLTCALARKFYTAQYTVMADWLVAGCGDWLLMCFCEQVGSSLAFHLQATAVGKLAASFSLASTDDLWLFKIPVCVCYVRLWECITSTLLARGHPQIINFCILNVSMKPTIQ